MIEYMGIESSSTVTSGFRKVVDSSPLPQATSQDVTVLKCGFHAFPNGNSTVVFDATQHGGVENENNDRESPSWCPQ
jgi:hypothetical protein